MTNGAAHHHSHSKDPSATLCWRYRPREIERRKDTFSNLVYSDTIGLKRLWARDYEKELLGA